MRKAFAIIVLVTCLAACGVVGVLIDGLKYAKAVEADLLDVTGLRPQVGFNWNNGRLTSVTITFPRLYDAKPLREVAEAARTAVVKEFKQKPEAIVLGFSIGDAQPGTSVEVHQTQ